MTTEEAITEFRKNQARGMCKPSFELAIEALEKQIPQKPMNGDIRFTLGYCPVCGESITERPVYTTSIGQIFTSYCPRCGQALDWSEEE